MALARLNQTQTRLDINQVSHFCYEKQPEILIETQKLNRQRY